MSWLGKIIGGTIGFFLGGPLGMIAGAVFGHVMLDQGASLADRDEDNEGYQERQYFFRNTGYRRIEYPCYVRSEC